jgi:hypothetical protein
VRRRVFAVALSLLAVAGAPTRASADEPDETSHPDAPHFYGRLGAVAAYRSLYDLSLLGGGVGLSLGAEGDRFGLAYSGRALALDVLGGLHAMELSGSVTLEWRVFRGLRLGAGVGVTRLEVWRVTKDPSLVSWGPTVLARVGYDFGERLGAFVLVELEAQDQASGAAPWGPSLQVGGRF